jgi:hypothetical protein
MDTTASSASPTLFRLLVLGNVGGRGEWVLLIIINIRNK